jgi:hypothetical protein
MVGACLAREPRVTCDDVSAGGSVLMYKYFGVILAAALGLVFSALLYASPTHAALELANLPKACLPLEGWMSRDRDEACHCPPEDWCPATMEEMYEDPKMPPAIAMACCDIEYPGPEHANQCDVTAYGGRYVGCVGFKFLGPRPLSFCTKYEAEAVEGAQSSSDPDYNPELPENIEQAKRAAAVARFSQCYEDNVAGRLEDITQPGPSAYGYEHFAHDIFPVKRRPPTMFRGNNYHPSAFRDFSDNLDACVEEAREALNISYENKFTPFRYTFDGGLFEVYENVSAYFDYENAKTFMAGTLDNSRDAWKRENEDKLPIVRHGDAEKYKRGNSRYMHFMFNVNAPDTSDLVTGGYATTGLGEKLNCVDSARVSMCGYTHYQVRGCGDCLSHDTEVLLADGSRKQINTIMPGEKVKGPAGDVFVSEVIASDSSEVKLYSINDGVLKLTADHPVMTTVGWRAVDYNTDVETSVKKYGLQNVPQLKVGDVMVTDDGKLEVKSIKALPVEKDGRTYNLRLEGGESFYAGGILVKDNSK